MEAGYGRRAIRFPHVAGKHPPGPTGCQARCDPAPRRANAPEEAQRRGPRNCAGVVRAKESARGSRGNAELPVPVVRLLSVPQTDVVAQGRAIESIFSYVHDAALFVVVAGPWKNEESGQWRDCRQWMRRGWCRLEMLANALSPAVKQVLLAESATSITSHGPSGLFGQQWFTSPVGTADFSAEADRSALGPVVLAMLQNKKALALAQDDLLTYRFIHAVSAKTLAGTGTSVPAEASLDEWMAAMRFTSGSPLDEGRSTGWTPLMFAVMSGRVELCEWLLDAGCADVHSLMRKSYPQYALRKATPLLHAACMVHDSPDIVRLLIRRGANPFKRMPAFPYKPAAHQAAGFGHVGNIDVLAEHSAKLLQQRNWNGFTFAMA
eukprot:scaffold5087_cov71-Phaeocystis_antarctica.AAC.1